MPALAEGGPFLEKVRDLLSALTRAQRDYATYPANNPILVKRREDLMAKFDAILLAAGEIQLAVEAEDFFYEGASVYHDADRRDSIAFQFFRHGIRRVRFLRGFTQRELDGVLGAVNQDVGAEAADDDLITLLWTHDLPHFRFDALDDVDPQLEWVRAPERTLHDYIASLRESAGNSKFVHAIQQEGNRPARDPRGDLAAISLDPEEIAFLKRTIDADHYRDLVLEVIEILMHVLVASRDVAEGRNLLRVLERVVELSVEARNFTRASATLQALNALAPERPQLEPSIRGTLAKFGEPKHIKRLVEVVSLPANPPAVPPIDEEGLRDYLVHLGVSAVVPIAEGMGALEDRRLRKVFCDALAALVKNEPSRLASLSRDNRWFVARNVAYVLGLTRNPDALPILRGLAAHPNEKVRAEAVRAAGLLGSAAKEIVFKALADSDRLVRLLACDLVSSVADPVTPSLLQKLVTERAFDDKESAEKRALCVAFGKIAGEHALNPLSVILVRSGGLLGGKDEARLAAAAGILAIGTPAAIDYLKAGAASPDTVLAGICLQTLREAKLA